jgi:hypothetical protein
VSVLFAALIVGLVATSLVRPDVKTFVPTPPRPVEVGERSVGPILYTVDARSAADWVYFDFSRGAVVDVSDRHSLDWDIAFKRHRMITNGGVTNESGQGRVLTLARVGADVPTDLPEEGWVADEGAGDEPRNRALEGWYDYNFLSHILEPAERDFAIHTADGKVAIVHFLSYYCPGARSGCITFRYWYRGEGRAGQHGREIERPT